jgi:hypothetical protein
MRKIVVVIFSFLSLSLYAQREQFLQEIAWGASAGMNLSKVSFLHNLPAMAVELGDIGMDSRVKGGISARYISMKHFGVQLEINYKQGGWKERFKPGEQVRGVDFSGVRIYRRLDYIEIPLLSHIYFGKKTRLFFNTGPKLGVLVSYRDLKTNLTSEQIAVFNPNDPRIFDKGHNSFDYGLSVGGGLDLQIGRLHTIVEGRYTFGFGDVYSNSKSDIYQRSNNQDFAVTVGFLLPVKTFYGN